MKRSWFVILAVFSAFLTGVGSYYVISSLGYPPARPFPCEQPPADSSAHQSTGLLDLEDFDVLVATVERPHKVFHINKVLNRREGYEQTLLTFSIDGSTLRTQILPTDSVSVAQVSTHKNNLEYSVNVLAVVDGMPIKITIPIIQTGMVIRAQPTVGKFGGSTAGPISTISIADQQYPSYGALTAAYYYQYDPVDIQMLKVQTKWLMYWDKSWNFYHLDKTDMVSQSASYYPHAFLSKISREFGVIAYYPVFTVRETDNSGIKGYKIDTASGESTDSALDLEFISSVSPYRSVVSHLVTSHELGAGGIGIFMDLDATN